MCVNAYNGLVHSKGFAIDMCDRHLVRSGLQTVVCVNVHNRLIHSNLGCPHVRKHVPMSMSDVLRRGVVSWEVFRGIYVRGTNSELG